jgi:hypothetical protein
MWLDLNSLIFYYLIFHDYEIEKELYTMLDVVNIGRGPIDSVGGDIVSWTWWWWPLMDVIYKFVNVVWWDGLTCDILWGMEVLGCWTWWDFVDWSKEGN